MPWGWECRAKLIKQVPLKPTERRLPISGQDLPGPNHYEPPEIFCGKGFSKIKRAPAYSFGLKPPLIVKPTVTARAPVLDISGMGKKGQYRITHGVVTPVLEDSQYKFKVPAPNAYLPPLHVHIKRPPAYSMRKAPKPPYESSDMWTPPPNMYNPPVGTHKKKFPSFSMGRQLGTGRLNDIPGPGEYDPKDDYIRRDKPKYSFGYQLKTSTATTATPAPNEYCEKKFNYTRPWVPAPSFGIKHSPYANKTEEYLLQSPRVDLLGED